LGGFFWGGGYRVRSRRPHLTVRVDTRDIEGPLPPGPRTAGMSSGTWTPNIGGGGAIHLGDCADAFPLRLAERHSADAQADRADVDPRRRPPTRGPEAEG